LQKAEDTGRSSLEQAKLNPAKSGNRKCECSAFSFDISYIVSHSAKCGPEVAINADNFPEFETTNRE